LSNFWGSGQKHALFDGISMYINVDFGRETVTIYAKKRFVSPQRLYERIKLLELI
jgi:hypothetical protein